MNNANMNRFTINPTSLDTKRSRFSRPFKNTFTFDAGKLIPFYVEEVLPGDSVSLDLAALVRQTTPIHPTMDNSYLEFHFYFVPNRLVWTHWEAFMGQNDTASPWLPPTSYSVPKLYLGDSIISGKLASGFTTGVDVGTNGDYMGLPLGVGNSNASVAPEVNALPFRGLALIWNQWYRDEAIQAPADVKTDDTTQIYKNTGVGPSSPNDYAYWVDYRIAQWGSQGGAPFPVCKLHDYFTSALPAPQRGPDVTLPLGSFAPIVNNNTVSTVSPLWYNNNTLVGSARYLSTGSDSYTHPDNQSYPSPSSDVWGVKMAADLSNATAATINTIRWAFQLQKYYEKLARGGSRYNEFIQSFFGVHVPDERLQRTEFLGGRRIPLNVTQVAQTSTTPTASNTGLNKTPLGELGAFSQTADSHSYFTKSFVEHGFLFGLCFVRTDRTYQQGLNRMWSRSDMIDYYNPVFANIGEQPIKNKEIYLQNRNVLDSNGLVVNEKSFGFQEAWAEYRFSPNRVSGEFHSQLTASLDSWHYADKYGALPTLSSGWIREPQENVQRTLAVSGVPQYLADVQVYSTWTRVMPLYSIPGLVDHH